MFFLRLTLFPLELWSIFKMMDDMYDKTREVVKECYDTPYARAQILTFTPKN